MSSTAGTVHLALQGDLGVHQLVLVGHRDVLAGAHRERARDQRRYAGQDHRVGRRAAAAEPGDQRRVRDQAVGRAEHRRPQPPAGHVPMTVRPARDLRRAPGRARRPEFAVPRLPGHAGGMHETAGVRDPAVAFPLPSTRDDVQERRDANRAIAVSAIGLAATGIVELLLAILTGSVGLLGDAIHNLSDVSTSAVVFLGFRLSRKGPSERYPYGLERAEDLAGIGIAVVIWASALFAGAESVRKLIEHGHTTDIGWGIVGAVVGILGNQLGAGYKPRGGRGIGSATLVADAKHS